MKKVISVLLAVILILFMFTFPTYAEDKPVKISIALSSDISGFSQDDYEKLAVIQSDGLKFSDTGRTDPIIIADYTGDVYLEEMKAGRTYYIDYAFVAEGGYCIPDKISGEDVEFIADSGCEVIWYGTAVGTGVDGCRLNYFSLHTKVKVKGNFFQNIFGSIADFFAKLLAWSPY